MVKCAPRHTALTSQTHQGWPCRSSRNIPAPRGAHRRIARPPARQCPDAPLLPVVRPRRSRHREPRRPRCSSAIGRLKPVPPAASAAWRSASTRVCSAAWPSSAFPSLRRLRSHPTTRAPTPWPKPAPRASCSTPTSSRSSTSPTTALTPTSSWSTSTACRSRSSSPR